MLRHVCGVRRQQLKSASVWSGLWLLRNMDVVRAAVLKQTQGNPFEKHARPSGGGRQPPVWTWFAQGDDGPKRPARNTWLQDGAQATSGNFIERRERDQVLHQPRGAPEHSPPTVASTSE